MRELATIRKIIDIQPIPKADAIEVATVDGWRVVVKKGEFSVGDLALYLEVDCWVPHSIAPFLTKEGSEPKVYNDVPGQRLRTIKLRGQLSQGLLLPVSVAYNEDPADYDHVFLEGDDVTELLGIQKWEKPIPAQLAGIMRGNFPSYIPKTDQERAQNLVAEIKEAEAAGLLFELSEKLEGTSLTVYFYDGDFGVCSRNLDLKETEGNTYWGMARKYNLEEKMSALDGFYAIQAEIVGPGIQDNIYQLTEPEMFVFDVYDIKAGVYMRPADRRAFVEKLGLKHAPVISEHVTLSSVDRLLDLADGNSVLYPTLREGLVYKQVDGGMTFKTVSNKYLLLHGD